MIRFIVIFLASITSALACSEFPSGGDWSGSDLAKNSSHIGLYKLTRAEHLADTNATRYTLELVEKIRGDFDKELMTLEYYSHNLDVKHFPNDFNGHTQDIFWSNDDGRMQCNTLRCHCRMNHTFKTDELYLLFPLELRGAKKSAEIIKNKNDRWLKYVIQKNTFSTNQKSSPEP